jgi:hypothetical protein
MDQLKGASMLSKIYLRYEYHQIRVKKEYVPKAKFRLKYGHYELLVMPFGKNSAHNFQFSFFFLVVAGV